MRALGIASGALLAVACAPVSSFRPASGMMDGYSGEVGIAGSLVGPRPFVEEDTQAQGQLWMSKRVNKDLTLTGIGAVETSAFAVGGSAQIDVLRTRRFVIAPDVQAGLVFAAFDAGAALRMWGETWLYTAPRFGNRGTKWAIDVPAGISAHLYEGFMLRAEYRLTWAGELSYYEQRPVFGVALARQF